MKLYIPTCTLNFNNIFSSESISPLSFYPNRGFGNKRFYSVSANNFDDMIVLYSKFPRYSVENSDIENYPMVIEIETKDYPENYFHSVMKKDDVEVFTCHNTIYLNPFHCFIYFFDYESRQGVLTKAEQSLENKFSKLYSANLLIKQQVKKSWLSSTIDIFTQTKEEDFSWSQSYLQFDLQPIKSDYKKDIIIDRIKGFIYCYMIGANQSVSAETGKLKAIARNLRNTLSAVVNSPDKQPTHSQDDILVKGIKEFNEIYSAKDQESIYNKKVLESRLSANPLGLSAEDCVILLQHWNLFDVYCSKINLKRVYDAGELWSCLEYSSPDVFSRVIDNLQYAVKRIENADLSDCTKHAIKNLIQIGSDLNINIVDTSYNTDFYQSLIRSQINAEYVNIMNESGVEEPIAQAFNGGRILKTIMGEKWEGSNVSIYIKALLCHFQENASFDLFSSDSDVITSFAAFCQKGDNIDRLSEYLVQCGFSNYRLAFGIYGATRGFASLPKTFTSVLINGNKEYYREIFLSIYSQIFNIQITNTDFPVYQNDSQSRVIESKIGTTIIKNISNIELKPSRQNNIINAVSKAIDLEEAVQSPRAFMYIADNILSKNSGAYKALEKADFKNDKHAYTEESFREKVYSIIEPALPSSKQARKDTIEKVNQILQLEAKKQDPEAFLCILDNFLDKNSKAYRNIMKVVQNASPKPDSFLNKTQKKKDTREITLHFTQKDIDLIVAFICKLNLNLGEFAIKQIYNDLKWVFDPKYSERKSELELLETFRSILISGKTERTSKKGKDMTWKNDAYSPLDIEKTIKALKEKIN